MNCKPGEMAYVARTLGDKETEAILGWTFELTEIVYTSPSYGPYWGYRGERRVVPGTGRLLTGVGDCILQPIRDIGDDVVDEYQAHLPPVPTSEGDPTKTERETEKAT